MLDKESRAEFIRTWEAEVELLRNSARILDTHVGPKGLSERLRRCADEWEEQIIYMKKKWEQDFETTFWG